MKRFVVTIALVLLCFVSVLTAEAQYTFLSRAEIGFRYGRNYADMKYSYKRYGIYSHQHNWQDVYGFYLTDNISDVFAIRPEVDFIGRGTMMDYEDIHYSLDARYVDVRLPLIISLAPYSLVNPYLFAGPEFCLVRKGVIAFDSRRMGKISTQLTKGNIRPYDFAVIGGMGFKIPIRIGKFRFSIAAEAGYNFGIMNTFSEDELAGDIHVMNPLPYTFASKGTRNNRGIEGVAMINIPLGNFKRIPKHEDVVAQASTKKNALEYEIKDCYSFEEMYNLVKTGKDVKNMRICVFDMNFQFASSELMPSAEQYLDNVIGMMKAYPGMQITINGHTDNIGSAESNQTLSEQRAQAVFDYLVSHGIDARRMTCNGYGLRYPIDTNDTDEGRARNRRVEIEVVKIK